MQPQTQRKASNAGRLAATALLCLAAAGFVQAPTPARAQGNVTQLPPVSLAASEVGQIISQAVQEARARNKPATIAVTDRVGNVLGVFRMNGAPFALVITTNKGIPKG